MKNFEHEKKSRIQLRKEREREYRREEIIKAAEKLFLTRGFDKTKMEDIAYEATLSKGTLYNYFNSKEQLYLGIASIAYNKLLDYTKKALEGLEPGINKLTAFGKAFYNFSKEWSNYTKVIHNYDSKTSFSKTVMEDKDNISSSREYAELHEFLNQYRTLFVQIINEGIENHTIREDLDPIILALSLSMLTGGLIKELTKNKDFLKNFKISEDIIITLVFEWIAEGLKPKSKLKNQN